MAKRYPTTYFRVNLEAPFLLLSSRGADRSDDRSVTAINASDQEMEWVAEDWRVSFMRQEYHAIVHLAFMQGWLRTGARVDRVLRLAHFPIL